MNGRTATILHADLDAFYASVEQLLDPSLRGKPIAVGGGVVLAASYEAKAFGVRGGMPGRQARELCPQLTFVSGHFQHYQRLGDAAIKVVNDFTPLVERISVTERVAESRLAKRTRTVTVRPGLDLARRREPILSARCSRVGRKTRSSAGFLPIADCAPTDPARR